MLFALLQEAWISIGASRMRTFLAMLGIVIGVASVVLMLAIGAGSQREIEDSINKLGTNLLMIMPGGHAGGVMQADKYALSLKDVDAVAQLPSILAASGSTFPRAFQAGVGKITSSVQVIGTTTSYFEITNWTFAEGAPFSIDDTQQSQRVAVVGATTLSQLFPEGGTIVGRMLRINNVAFRVVGVLDKKGTDFSGRDQDNSIFIPITTAKSRLWEQNSFGSILQIVYVKAASKDMLEEANDDMTELLRQRHKIRDAAENNFTVTNLSEITQAASDTTKSMSLLLGAIASISLVVGGIGITNIMLVTVTERTREIGIRKAIGATESHILLQFLLEAILIACVGSFVGLVIGFGFGMAAHEWFSLAVDFNLWPVILALGVATVVGIFSGLYPAYKAAKLQPIEALRTIGG